MIRLVKKNNWVNNDRREKASLKKEYLERDWQDTFNKQLGCWISYFPVAVTNHRTKRL